MESTRFVLTAVGTHGDVLPLVALAHELASRGFRADVLANECGTAEASSLGVPYTVIAPSYDTNLASLEENFGRYVFPSYAPTFRFFERALREGGRIVVVNWGNCSASTLLCERLGLPLCRLVIAPYYLDSLSRPPEPWASYLAASDGSALARRAILTQYCRHLVHPFLLRNVNAWRRALELRPVGSIGHMNHLVQRYIGLFPPWYGDAPEDWPRNFDRVGFPLPPPRRPLEPEVVRWLARFREPLVFVPGTGAGAAGGERFAAAAADVCERLRKPGVILGSGVEGAVPRASLLRLRYCDLGLLLPHAAAVIHHGGMGTTARALQAGVPQVVSPQGFDQPDNAANVAGLGVGVVVPRSDLTGAVLEGAISRWSCDPIVNRRARCLAERVARWRGVERAADCLIANFASDRGSHCARSVPSRSSRTVGGRWGDPGVCPPRQ